MLGTREFIVLMAIIVGALYLGDRHTTMREKKVEAIGRANLECVLQEKR